jgi:import inner membrane translocase subunit TIM44
MSAAHASSAAHTQDVIQPNEEVKGVAVTKKQSSWWHRWQRLKEDNPLSNMIYSLRMKYDESDHLVVRGSRAVTDRVGEAFGSVMNQSDMAQALAEIKKMDRNFDKEQFIEHCRFEIIPTVLEAYVRGDLELLKDWCHEAAFNVIAAVVKQRAEPGVTVQCKILEVRDTDIVMAKLMDPGPVLVLSFQAQQLTLKTRQGEDGQAELLENVYYVWALCRDQTQYDPITAWKVLEFGIAAAGKMLV